MTFHAAAGGAALRGWLHDICRNGCFIATQSQLAVGEVFDLEFRLPATVKPVSGKGRVVWVRDKSTRDAPGGMGVELLDIPAEDRETIGKLVGGVTPKPARSRTIVGIAPPPAASSPAFSPSQIEPSELAPPTDTEITAVTTDETEVVPRTDTVEEGIPIVEVPIPPPAELEGEAAPFEPPPPEPPPPPPAPAAPAAPGAPGAPPPALPLVRAARPKWNKRLVAGIAAAVAVVCTGIAAIVLAITHHGAAGDAGPLLDVAPEAETADVGADSEQEDATLDVSTTPAVDASRDAAQDAGRDAGRDGGKDGGHDGGRDGGRDAGKKDAGKHKPTPGHH